MPTASPLDSLAALARASDSPERFSYALRDFLDGFYLHPAGSKLEEEPRALTETLRDGGYADAYLAALAEHLAGKNRLPVPRWAFDSARSLREPAFAFNTPAGPIFLLVESPTAFRVRNIFISADGLNRV